MRNRVVEYAGNSTYIYTTLLSIYMFDGKKLVEFIKALGNPIGRVGPYIFRKVYGKIIVSGVCKDYHYSNERKDIERLERFGAAGCVAKAVNSNMTLKVIWGEYLHAKRKKYHSIFNQMTKAFYRYVTNTESGVRDVLPSARREGERKAFKFSGERLKIVPAGDFIADAEILFISNEIIVKPGDAEVWDGAAAVIVFYDTKGNERCIRLAGSKCKARNAELRRLERVREERRNIRFARGVVERCMKWLEGVYLLNEEGVFTEAERKMKMRNAEIKKMRSAECGVRNVSPTARTEEAEPLTAEGSENAECGTSENAECGTSENAECGTSENAECGVRNEMPLGGKLGIRKSEVGMEEGEGDANFRMITKVPEYLVREAMTGELGGRKYLTKLLKEVKEYLNRDYIPDAEELIEIYEELDCRERRILEEDLKEKEIYAQQVKRERKYMNKLIGAMSAELELQKDGTYRASLGEKGLMLAERFNKFSIYVTCYIKDAEGFAAAYSETIFSSGKVFDEERTRKVVSFLIALSISRYMRRTETVLRE